MAAETPRCYAPKDGRIALTCELDEGHEGWHRAVYHDRQEITYQGAHHVVDLTESVTWEPFAAQLAATMRRITAGRKEAAMPP